MLLGFVKQIVEIALLLLESRNVTTETKFNTMAASNVDQTVKLLVPYVGRTLVMNAILLVGIWLMIFVTQSAGMVQLFNQNNVMMAMMRYMTGVMNVNFNVRKHVADVKMEYALIVLLVGR